MMGLTKHQFEEAGNALANWRKPLLLSHAKPDGDALGSLAAMRAVLKSLGADPLAILFDDVSNRYGLFGQYDVMPKWLADVHESDLADVDGIVVLDTCTYNQLDPIADWLRTSEVPKLAVDHHVTREDLADHYLVDESAAATCLILYEWAKHMGWSLDRATCQALFVGIAMDTGWFIHSNTDARVLAAAAELTARGVLPHELHQQLFQKESEARIRLFGAALQTMELSGKGQLAVLRLSKDTMAKAGATQADTEDIVNEPLRIGSVVASVLLVESDNNLIRASFRSKPPSEDSGSIPDVDVAEIAREFGGGGHKRAAGARIEGSIEDVRQRVLARLEPLFK